MIYGRDAVVYRGGLKTISVKNQLKGVGDDLLVVDHQNTGSIGTRSGHNYGESRPLQYSHLRI